MYHSYDLVLFLLVLPYSEKNMIMISCKLSCLATRDQLDDLKDKNLSVQMHVELPQVWTPLAFEDIYTDTWDTFKNDF